MKIAGDTEDAERTGNETARFEEKGRAELQRGPS